MSELPARLTGFSATQIAALILLLRYGEAERHRYMFVHEGRSEQIRVTVAQSLTRRGLATIVYRSGRHRLHLVGDGARYARTALAQWSERVSA